MSKTDALRAIKDARRAAASTPAAKPARPPITAPTAARTATSAPQRSAPEPEQATDGLCGHRSMNGRSCTRPGGHAEKNHRYG